MLKLKPCAATVAMLLCNLFICYAQPYNDFLGCGNITWKSCNITNTYNPCSLIEIRDIFAPNRGGKTAIGDFNQNTPNEFYKPGELLHLNFNPNNVYSPFFNHSSTRGAILRLETALKLPATTPDGFDYVSNIMLGSANQVQGYIWPGLQSDTNIFSSGVHRQHNNPIDPRIEVTQPLQNALEFWYGFPSAISADCNRGAFFRDWRAGSIRSYASHKRKMNGYSLTDVGKWIGGISICTYDDVYTPMSFNVDDRFAEKEVVRIVDKKVGILSGWTPENDLSGFKVDKDILTPMTKESGWKVMMDPLAPLQVLNTCIEDGVFAHNSFWNNNKNMNLRIHKGAAGRLAFNGCKYLWNNYAGKDKPGTLDIFLYPENDKFAELQYDETNRIFAVNNSTGLGTFSGINMTIGGPGIPWHRLWVNGDMYLGTLVAKPVPYDPLTDNDRVTHKIRWDFDGWIHDPNDPNPASTTKAKTDLDQRWIGFSNQHPDINNNNVRYLNPWYMTFTADDDHGFYFRTGAGKLPAFAIHGKNVVLGDPSNSAPAPWLGTGKNRERAVFNCDVLIPKSTNNYKLIIGGTNGEGLDHNNSTYDNYLLQVNGVMAAKELIITDDQWADFVFEDTYKLQPLTEVEEYIANNKHLPNIPTQEQVKEKGVSVGEMQVKLLQKVEELTLHLIQLSKDKENLMDQNKILAAEIEQIKQQLSK